MEDNGDAKKLFKMATIAGRELPRKKKRPKHKQWEKDTPRTTKAVLAGSAIFQLLERMGLADRVREQSAVTQWDEIVGEQISAVSKATSIREGILHVKVSDPAWRQELTYLKPQIISEINRTLRQSIVSNIIFS